ncbi:MULTISPECIES: esterase/lipase family protein [unclassified Nocardia]|uniref:esterase/lipase family protein n=1 Tax=unclassified Nocardia TaxID=2637762 RepID=UPI0033AFE9A9
MEQRNRLWVWGTAQKRRAGALGLVLAAALGGWAAPLAAAEPAGYRPAVVPTEPGPRQSDHLAAARYIDDHPSAVPQGLNDFGCKPTAGHPRPVVLVHGTDSSAYSDWAGIGPQLVDAGMCVFALNYGGAPGADTYGTEDMRVSFAQVGAFVDDVLAATGATKVDLVGFSQGATVSRFYVNKLGGAAKVGTWVGLASPSYGGVMYGLVPVGQAVPGMMDVFAKVTSTAAVQQAQGEPLMVELNAGGDTVPGVRYVTVGSRVDEMIQPFDNIALHGAGAENLVLQDLCADDLTGHFHMVYDPFVQQLLLQVLDPAHAPAPVCAPVAFGTGIPQVIIAGNS